MNGKVRGVFCAAATPVTRAGEPHLKLIARHVRQLVDDGCHGVALLGTTGEANAFSIPERCQILEAAAAAVAPEKLMPGTGVCAISDTVALTRHALSAGVTRVVMLPPFYYKNVSDDGVFAAYSEIIERIGDGRLQVILYHIPQTSMVPLSFTLIERLMARYPQTVVGIKDSSGDLKHAEALIRSFPGLSVLVGADANMRSLLAVGGAGCITATSNIVAADLSTVFRHHADTDRQAEVDAAQQRIIRTRAISANFVHIPAVKAMLARRYRDETWLNVRPPLESLTRDEIAELDRLMTGLE